MIDFVRMRILIRKVAQIEWDAARAASSAMKITATITGMPGGGERSDKTADGAIRLAEIHDAYRETFAELEAMREELRPLIDALEDPDEKGVMRLRYLSGHRPEVIAKALYMSDRKVYYCLNKGERRIRKQYLQ